MANTDEYLKLKTKEKDRMFIELFALKDAKAQLEKRIKEIESDYKQDTVGLKNDKFFITSTNIKFSFKCSQRAGSVDTKAMIADGINVDGYRKPSIDIVTLRVDK